MGPAGRYADREMRAALAELRMTAPPGAIARYAHAADRLARLRSAWEDAGSPATAVGSPRTGHRPSPVGGTPPDGSVRDPTGGGVRHQSGAWAIQVRRPSGAGPQGDAARVPGRPDRPPACRWTPMTPPRGRSASVPGDGPAARATRLAVAHVLYVDDDDERDRWRSNLAQCEAALLDGAFAAASGDDRPGRCAGVARRRNVDRPEHAGQSGA